MLTVESVKALGSAKNRSEENLDYLIKLFTDDLEAHKIPVEVKREIASSIGRNRSCNPEQVKLFLHEMCIEKAGQLPMEVVYQMFRTALYMSREDASVEGLVKEMLNLYHNEVMDKMYNYFYRKQHREHNFPKSVRIKSPITRPLLLGGKADEVLSTIPNSSIQLVFTSPPYYNAREYSDYKNYQTYLNEMEKVFRACARVLEAGRFMIVDVSPVITRRPGREFESIRYPIHYDFHHILCESGFYFVDEVYWVKPEPSVPNRVGGYLQTRKPLGYKPNCVTESIMIYRKDCDFLLDEVMAKYPEYDKHIEDGVDTSNCWYITPKSDKDHPAVFPEDLCKKVIRYYSFEGDAVLDPFAGSGTFGRVAIEMSRIPVLCEANPEYINVILKRGGF